MKWTLPRSGTAAQFVSGMLVASALGLGSVASASAQTAFAAEAQAGPQAAPATLRGTPRGLSLDEARAALQAAARANNPTPNSATPAALAASGISAVFVPSQHNLVVIGTSRDDTIVISRTVAGTLLVNGGAVAILGPAATVANTTLIEVFGLEGNDGLSLSETNGALPNADLFGGTGNDTLTGGSGADQLFGESGNDTLLGKGGNDFLSGGSGDDVLTGGAGDDQVFGESGNDRIIWNPGDGSDLNEGGDDADTIEVNGGNAAESFTATPNGARVRFDRVTPAPFTLDIGTAENLVLNMNGGDDSFVGSNGLRSLITLTVDGGSGNDTIVGGDGDDLLIGGDGNDTITGGRGNDVSRLGGGDDVFIWNPGDGSDTVEGQSGTDTLTFNGSNIGEQFDLSANGSRVRFTRDVAGIVMDLNGIERVNLKELGGADQTTVNDLTGTGLTEVNLDLTGSNGGGDAAADTVIVNATNANDAVKLSGSGPSVAVDGLAARVVISGGEAVTDRLLVNGLGGDDVIDGSFVGSGAMTLVLSGGDGDDVLLGGAGDDQLLGGAGDDVLLGGPGFDLLDGGTGDNVLLQD